MISSRERALAQGIFNSGAVLGAVISAPVIALLYVQLGWKGAFVAVGLLGFVWLLPRLPVYKARRKGTRGSRRRSGAIS